MRWDDFRRSDNVEDDRDGGGGFRRRRIRYPGGRGGLGIGTIVVLGLIGWALGIDPSVLIGGAEILSGGGSQYQQPIRSRRRAPARRPTRPASSLPRCSAIPRTSGREIFRASGRQYRPAPLRLYRGGEQGGCGFAQAAMGPFYCPRDKRIYLDTSFFREMQQRFHGCSGKACEFAEAYVIAHEVGHHVQDLLGILPKAQRRSAPPAARRRQTAFRCASNCRPIASPASGPINPTSAGNRSKPGDVEAALQTAAAIGDDRLQKQSRGYVVPDAFTHGTSAQRQRWFTNGLKEGKVSACDTFAAAAL